MALIDTMLQELELETQTTRRVLERVPKRSVVLAPPPDSEDAWAAGGARGDRACRSRGAGAPVAGSGTRFRGASDSE